MMLFFFFGSTLTLRLFQRKTLCKDSFPYFPIFGSIKKKKMNQMKTIFGQHKRYDFFGDCFPLNFFGK